jgi:hypothetical protein
MPAHVVDEGSDAMLRQLQHRCLRLERAVADPQLSARAPSREERICCSE